MGVNKVDALHRTIFGFAYKLRIRGSIDIVRQIREGREKTLILVDTKNES